MTDLDAILKAAQELKPDTTITLLESHEGAPTGVSRVGGPGFDLGEGQPTDEEGEPLTHVWTLATADVPALARAYPEAVAVALYVLNPQENEAFEVDNGQTALVVLTREDVERGAAEPTDEDLQEREVTARQVEVSSSAFEGDDPDEEEDSPRNVLRRAIYGAGARAGGRPIWLQGDEYEGEFLLQFDESFVDINLGDAGVMYIFTDQQFWQCH